MSTMLLTIIEVVTHPAAELLVIQTKRLIELEMVSTHLCSRELIALESMSYLDIDIVLQPIFDGLFQIGHQGEVFLEIA